MLTLIDPSYTPPTAYAILEDPQFPKPGLARALYDVIEALKNTPWFTGLAEYGITRLEFVGMLEDLSDLSRKTIHFVLPRSPGNIPGFMTQWAAYHQTMFGDFVFSWNPWDDRLGVDGWMIGATHELFEALTDAEPGYGWVNTQKNDEGADDCQGGIPFAGTQVSPWWSNRLGRCVGPEDMNG